MPLQRVARGDEQSLKSGAVEDVELAEENDSAKYNHTDTFAPDSIDALEKIDSTCYWIPIYDATRGRIRGIIVKRNATGHYQRLGFAEFQTHFSALQADKHAIGLVQFGRVLL